GQLVGGQIGDAGAVAAAHVGRDRAQRVQQLAVVGARAAAQQARDVDVDLERGAGPDLARDRRGVALEDVAGGARVGLGAGGGAREDVLAVVLGVGLLLDGVGQLVDLVGGGGQVGGRLVAVGGLHRQLLRALEHAHHVGQRRVGRRGPGGAVGDRVVVVAQPLQVVLELDGQARPVGIVGGLVDPL